MDGDAQCGSWKIQCQGKESVYMFIRAMHTRKPLQRPTVLLALSLVVVGLFYFYSFTSKWATFVAARYAANSATRWLCDPGDMATSKKKSLLPKRNAEHYYNESELQPLPGVAGGGESINPMGLPDEQDRGEELSGNPRPAPSPGVPVSGDEYERLKERAKSVRQSSANHGQEDPSAKP
jgi:hypothetical protein